MTNAGESMGDKIRKGVGLVHGSGEAIRGNFNATVDSAAGDQASATRHTNVANRGLDEIQHGHYHGTGAGVTPVDTERERQNRALQGESLHSGSTTHGPHSTNIGNKTDPRVDSDLDSRGGTGLGSSTTGPTGTTGLGSSNYGPHSSNIGNKADPRVDSDLDGRGTMGHTTTTNTTSGLHGHQSTGLTSHQGTGIMHDSTTSDPHTSNLSNKLAGTHGSTNTTGMGPATSNFASSLEQGNTTGTAHHGTGYDSTNHGPHSSNLANKLDPRVDSDKDNRAAGVGTGTGAGHSHGAGQGRVNSLVEEGERSHGITGTGVNHGTTGTGFTHGTSTGSGLSHGAGQGRVDSLVDGKTVGNTTTHGSTNYGPHDSNIANKADPRVDSDLDGRGVGHGTTGVGSTTDSKLGGRTLGTGTTHSSTNYGPHDSNIANKADPRVDSDLDRRGVGHDTTGVNNTRVDEDTGVHTTGTGKHSTNHGPHDANAANKADPRADSDRDHRGTTHDSTNIAHSSKIANVLDPRVDSKTGTWK